MVKGENDFHLCGAWSRVWWPVLSNRLLFLLVSFSRDFICLLFSTSLSSFRSACLTARTASCFSYSCPFEDLISDAVLLLLLLAMKYLKFLCHKLSNNMTWRVIVQHFCLYELSTYNVLFFVNIGCSKPSIWILGLTVSSLAGEYPALVFILLRLALRAKAGF